MKKVFILFLLLFSVGISYSQSQQINFTGEADRNADVKFAKLLESETYVKSLPALLEILTENPDKYTSTRSFNSEIVSHIINDGIGQNKEVINQIRNYFGSTDPAIISESESYLLENL